MKGVNNRRTFARGIVYNLNKKLSKGWNPFLESADSSRSFKSIGEVLQLFLKDKRGFGRELTSDPTLLIAAHPTRGIDVGAQAAVWDEIRAARDAGMAVLLVSADLEELIGLSDRIAVLFDGEVTAQLDPDRITPAELGGYMTGVRQEEGS